MERKSPSLKFYYKILGDKINKILLMKELLPLNLPDKKLMKINRLSIVKDLAYCQWILTFKVNRLNSCQSLKGDNRIKDLKS